MLLHRGLPLGAGRTTASGRLLSFAHLIEGDAYLGLSLKRKSVRADIQPFVIRRQPCICRRLKLRRRAQRRGVRKLFIGSGLVNWLSLNNSKKTRPTLDVPKRAVTCLDRIARCRSRLLNARLQSADRTQRAASANVKAPLQRLAYRLQRCEFARPAQRSPGCRCAIQAVIFSDLKYALNGAVLAVDHLFRVLHSMFMQPTAWRRVLIQHYTLV